MHWVKPSFPHLSVAPSIGGQIFLLSIAGSVPNGPGCGKWHIIPPRTTKTGGASMFVLSVDLRVKPENVEAFLARAIENAAGARKEPGCRQFDILVDPKDRTRLMLYEV